MASGEPGSVREGCLPRYGKDAYVMRFIDLHWSLIQLIVIDAALGEVLTTCSKMDWLLRHGEKYLRPETRSSPLILGYKKAEVHYEPLGVVAAIVSWNYRMTSISPPFSFIDLLQRYTMLGLPFWRLSFLAMPLSLSARNMLLGRQNGSSTLLRNAYGSVTSIQSWCRYVFF